MRSATFLLALLFACLAFAQSTAPYRWTKFVSVEGQPEPVPQEWVSTPEGKFAHSIKIPNPVPKDSGYRAGMTSQQYFEHLCKTEAGEFIYKTVDNVEGFYFMRPPKRPSDKELKARFKLEAPELERVFALLRQDPVERSVIFVYGESRPFRYVEEPDARGGFIRSYGFLDQVKPNPAARVTALTSQHLLTWRGLVRARDREFSISGGEWLVLDRESNQVLGVRRNYGLSPLAKGVAEGVWWLNATPCPNLGKPNTAADGADLLYAFVSRVLRPTAKAKQ